MAGNVDELEAYIDEGIRLGRANDYHPTTFIRMRAEYGTVGAIECKIARNFDPTSKVSQGIDLVGKD